MMGSMDMVTLRIDKRFLDKATNVPKYNMKGCLTLYLKRNGVSPYGPIFLGVVRGMNVGILPVQMVFVDVVRWTQEE